MADLLSGPTKCLLVRPEFFDDTFYSMQDVCDLMGVRSAAPPLGLITVAAMLPEHWDLCCVDEDVQPLTDDDLDWADIVMISGIGSQQGTILKVTERAHARGKLVVVGGSGPSLQPESFPTDFVVAGEGEDTVPQLLADLGAGKTSGFYRSTHRADMRQAVTPRYDLLDLGAYLMVGVGFARGCPFSCEFCAQIQLFGNTTRTKSAEQVIKELQFIHDLGFRGQIDFGYDNLIGDIDQAAVVLAAMAEWGEKHRWPFTYSTEATMNLARLPKILELMQENDFRMVFIGIESGDEDVLRQTKKGQNTAMAPSDAVRVINEHGMIINTGLILGFDAENDDTADSMLKMLQRTGAFPTLILPLHALPATALQERMRAEKRLFADGVVAMNTTKRTDTATTGLNFVTARPRTAILSDLIRVLEEAYYPKAHYDRVNLTVAQLNAKPKYKPSFAELLRYIRAFFRVVFTIGRRKKTRGPFWRTFFRTLFRKPLALDKVIILAVMHDNYMHQSTSYVDALRTQISFIEQAGEEQFNREMLLADAAPQMLDGPSAMGLEGPRSGDGVEVVEGL